MGQAWSKPKPPSRVKKYAQSVARWFPRGVALYALCWFGMKYIGSPWEGMSLLWSFLIVVGAVLAIGIWGDSAQPAG